MADSKDAETGAGDSGTEFIQKFGVPVRLVMNGGEEKIGVMYLQKAQRLLEMLCDERPFVPFRSGPNLYFLNKSSIQQAEILSLTYVADRSHFFPGVDIDAMKANILSNRGAYEVTR